MSDKKYDLVVIGAGPGGYTAAIRAAQLGMNVACIEKEKALGGTCLRVGCIPSKAMLDSSELFATASHQFKVHGIQTGELSLNLAAMLKRKDKVVKTLTGGVAGLLKKNKITRLEGTARIIAPGKISVQGKEEQTLEAKAILIATGSAPVELPFMPFDGDRIVDSTGALAFAEVPKRLIVVGAGAIGLELGSVWARLGSEVLVVEALDRTCTGMDEELAAELQKILEKQGLSMMLGAKVKGADIGKTDVTVEIETAEGKTRKETADRVLVAVGRRPYTEGLGLEDAGIKLDERGRITVDENYCTNVDGVYAIGDVIDGPMLAHKAEEEGIACVETLAGGAGHVNYHAIPGVIYTWPEFAGVGLTEAEARDEGYDIAIGKFPFMANGRARAAEEKDGLVKIIADKKTDRVLGVHIVGPRASDLIAQAASVIEFEGSAEDIARTCHAHPTFAEAVKEAALDVAGRTINF